MFELYNKKEFRMLIPLWVRFATVVLFKKTLFAKLMYANYVKSTLVNKTILLIAKKN